MHTQPESNAPLFKMMIPLDKSAWHGYAVETVWVEGLPDKTLRLVNTPFFARGISYFDVVDVTIQDGQIVFARIRNRGGHSTYRLVLRDGVDDLRFEEYWRKLAAIGCTYECMRDLRLYAVDVPSSQIVKVAYPLLNAGEQDGVWGFEEGYYASP
jgi:Domain of unknown function (DUF4265)